MYEFFRRTKVNKQLNTTTIITSKYYNLILSSKKIIKADATM